MLKDSRSYLNLILPWLPDTRPGGEGVPPHYWKMDVKFQVLHPALSTPEVVGVTCNITVGIKIQVPHEASAYTTQAGSWGASCHCPHTASTDTRTVGVLHYRWVVIKVQDFHLTSCDNILEKARTASLSMGWVEVQASCRDFTSTTVWRWPITNGQWWKSWIPSRLPPTQSQWVRPGWVVV